MMDLLALDRVTIAGTTGAVASIASFTPQAWKIIGSRSTQGLSPGMIALPDRKTREVAETLDPAA